MGMAWPWKQHPPHLSTGEKLRVRWLALLKRDRPAAAGKETHHADANAWGGQ